MKKGKATYALGKDPQGLPTLSPLWVCAPLCMFAWQRALCQHLPHDSLVVVPQLLLDPSVQVPATICQAAPCRVPSSGLHQAVVESLGAGLVVLLLVFAIPRGPPLSATSVFSRMYSIEVTGQCKADSSTHSAVPSEYFRSSELSSVTVCKQYAYTFIIGQDHGVYNQDLLHIRHA